ncbi:MAG: hypothetical protein QM804_16160 [Propionicimonas sp.]
MRNEEPTDDEEIFFDALEELVPGVQDWYHKDADGTLWMIASYDVPDVGVIHTTLRCDYDGARLLGGRSPGLLNWDDGVRAEAAGVETSGDSGLDVAVEDPMAAAQLAAQWFRERIAAHRQH